VSWPLVQLKDIGNIVTGSTPSKSKPEYFGSDIPFISPSELGKSIYVDKAKQSLTEAGGKVSRLLPKNTVMVCCIGSLGKAAITATQVATNQQINSIIVDETIADPLFVYFYCLTLKPLLEAMAPATTVAIINKTRFSELKMPLPPLSVQKKIAMALEKADTLRGQCHQMEQELNTLAQSVFLDMFGDGYSSTELGLYTSVITSGSRGWAKYYSENGARFIRSLDVQMNYIGTKDIAYVDAPLGKEAERARVQHGDVLLTITGSRIGRVCWVTEDIDEAYISQHVALLRLSDKFLPEFVSYFLSMPALGQRQIKKAQYGQTKPGLNLTQIKGFTIPDVPIQEQQKFLETISANNHIKRLNSLNNSNIESLFNSLMQRAFKGELELKDVA